MRKANRSNLSTKDVDRTSGSSNGLPIAELSEPVRTEFGWHLIQLHERTEPVVTPFEEVKQKVIEYLQERRKDKVFDEFLDGLKKKAEITEVSGL